MSIVTHAQLARGLRVALGEDRLGKPEADSMAEYLLGFFGFDDEVIDNRLRASDRDVFYTLENAGILGTFVEEVNLKKGRTWRIHYWILRKDHIRYLLREIEVEEVEVDPMENLYDGVFDDIDEDRDRSD